MGLSINYVNMHYSPTAKPHNETLPNKLGIGSIVDSIVMHVRKSMSLDATKNKNVFENKNTFRNSITMYI